MDRVFPCLSIYLLLMAVLPAYAIDVTPATVPEDAPTLAGVLINAGSPITLNSANFLIDLVGGGTAESEVRSIGVFSNGNAGGELPTINRLEPGTSIPYAGGIGIDAGVCLCTGLITDSDVDGNVAVEGSGVGTQGPNNGFPRSAYPGPPDPSDVPLNAGEVSFNAGKPRDKDFVEQIKTVDPNQEGDATVLQFEISISSPGFLRISFVFASDEHPFWIDEQSPFDPNDSMAIFVRQESLPTPTFQNIATLNTSGQPAGSMSLRELAECGEIMFRDNQVVPAPDGDLIPGAVGDFPSSEHGFDKNFDNFNRPDDGVPYYNHEFGGFSKKLTRETPFPLAPGTYTIKIVVQDVFDRSVDSAIFLETGSLKLFTLARADYNGNGVVDQADYDVCRANFNKSPATFYDGDGNGNGTVDSADYTIWRNNLGATGNADFCGDFNRDGAVTNGDFMILQNYHNVLTECASRFEGDADRDGDVDDCDFHIWDAEGNLGEPVRPCACGFGASSATTSTTSRNDTDFAVLQARLPESPDVDGDGDVDESDLTALDALVAGSSTTESATAEDERSTTGDEPAPTLAEPPTADFPEHDPPLTPDTPSP